MAMDFLERPVRLVASLFLFVFLFSCRSADEQLDIKVEFYPGTSDTASVAYYKNYKEQGRWVRYHPNGKLMEERFFDNGKKTGIMKGWWPNGNLFMIYRFENDEYEGECSEWNDQGVLIRRMHYKKGYEDGLQKILWSSF